MSVAFVPHQKGRPPPNPATIQKMLDENSQLIQAIVDYQNKGKASECLQYQQILHRNLVYLASVADAGPNIQAHLPPPQSFAPSPSNPGHMQSPNPQGPGLMQNPSPQGPGLMQSPNPQGPGHMQSPNPQGPGHMQNPNPQGPGHMQSPNLQGPIPNSQGPNHMQSPGSQGAGQGSLQEGSNPSNPMMQGQAPLNPVHHPMAGAGSGQANFAPSPQGGQSQASPQPPQHQPGGNYTRQAMGQQQQYGIPQNQMMSASQQQGQPFSSSQQQPGMVHPGGQQYQQSNFSGQQQSHQNYSTNSPQQGPYSSYPAGSQPQQPSHNFSQSPSSQTQGYNQSGPPTSQGQGQAYPYPQSGPQSSASQGQWYPPQVPNLFQLLQHHSPTTLVLLCLNKTIWVLTNLTILPRLILELHIPNHHLKQHMVTLIQVQVPRAPLLHLSSHGTLLVITNKILDTTDLLPSHKATWLLLPLHRVRHMVMNRIQHMVGINNSSILYLRGTVSSF
ncbi:uncharacterized protein LOC143239878 [Tachypleus tridentatus]|uniref:uncharacterized protein LOC143239878 n=1 Tax=Tachypleus tridentatus TaxID=6853 RepID=UPI003FD4AE57